MRVGGWNCEGITKHLPVLRDMITKIEPETEAICLSELKCDMSETILADAYFSEHMMVSSTRDMYIKNSRERIEMSTKTQEGGTAIIMNPDLFKASKTADIKTDRLVFQKIRDDKINVLMGAVYMPTNGDQDKFEKMCSTLIEEVTKHRDEGCEVVLIGDMNISDSHVPRRKAVFNSMIKTLGLIIHKPRTYTNLSRNKNKSRSTLDYIITSPGVDVGEIEVYHLDRIPTNSSTHSPIFATIRIPIRETTTKEEESRKEDMLTSPFSNFLARKRPNWANMDKELFHKLVNTKIKAIWKDIGDQRADLPLNSIISILVRSALDASANVPERVFTNEIEGIKKLSKRISNISNEIKKIRTLDGKTLLDDLTTEEMKSRTTPKTREKYDNLQTERAKYRRDLNALQVRAQNIIHMC